jgi:hypothetical protein
MGEIMKSKVRGPVVLMLFVVAMLAGCARETPTSPTPTPPPGGTTPPTGATIAVTVSNPNPLVSSTSTVTATVTVGNQPVADGTAVEFSTNFGTFVDTAGTTTIRTTTNGVATATLTSPTPGTATVTVRVTNVSQTASINFRQEPVTPVIRPTITSVTPSTSTPAGGTIVTIRGSNFEDPVRVLFGTREATVISSSPTEIRVVVPSITLTTAEQMREVNIIVISRAGTPGEETATAPSPFRYELELLTPTAFSVSPSSGTNDGGTRIVIFGEGFQAPTRVFFGTGGAAGGSLAQEIELNVEHVTFNQIIALTPRASGLGADLRNLQVSLRVLNQASNRDFVLPMAFRYGPGLVVTAAGPTQGSSLGGTRVEIDGWGFVDPVAVTIGGVAARVISVSGTKIIAITNPPLITSCPPGGGVISVASGPIVVTNITTGETAQPAADGAPLPTFTYLLVRPLIVNVSPATPQAGSTIQVTVSNWSGGPARIKIGDRTLVPTSVVANPNGTATFTVTVPTDLTLGSTACPGGAGTVPQAASFNVTFQDLGTGCEDTIDNAISVQPVLQGGMLVSPTALTFTAVANTTTDTRPFDIINTGTVALTVNSVTVPGGPPFSAAFTGPVILQPCEATSATVTFAPAAAGSFAGRADVSATPAGFAPITRSVTLSGTATEPPPPGP